MYYNYNFIKCSFVDMRIREPLQTVVNVFSVCLCVYDVKTNNSYLSYKHGNDFGMVEENLLTNHLTIATDHPKRHYFN